MRLTRTGDQFIPFLRKNNPSWKEVYYKIWAQTITLNCQYCHNNFKGSVIYHPQEPDSVEYPCCGTFKLSTDEMVKGCIARNHCLATEWRSVERLYKQYEDYYNTMKVHLKPFGRQNQSNSGENIDSIPISKITPTFLKRGKCLINKEDSPSLQILLGTYIELKESLAKSKSEDQFIIPIESLRGKKVRSAYKKKSDKTVELKTTHKQKSILVDLLIENTNKKKLKETE